MVWNATWPNIMVFGTKGLPLAIADAGFFMGISLLVVLCGVTDWSVGSIHPWMRDYH